jgi:hypothetical protein
MMQIGDLYSKIIVWFVKLVLIHDLFSARFMTYSLNILHHKVYNILLK